MKNKKNKSKNKKLVIIILVLSVLVLITSFLIVKYLENRKISDIKKSYSRYALVENKSFYDKNKNIIGRGYNIEIELIRPKKITTKSDYFKVKDKDYYVYYEDIKKINNINKDTLNDNYVIFNKNIKTNKNVTLYKNNKKIISLKNGLNIPVYYMDDNNYYVLYLDKLLSVKKNNDIKLIDHKNSGEKISNSISVLLFDKIEDKSNSYDTVTTASFKNIVNKLKENGYYTITNNEFKDFLKGNINLKEKAILIEVNNVNDKTESLKNELGINIEKKEDDMKFNLVNKAAGKGSLDNTPAYSIKNYSNVDNVLKMAGGEEIHEEEPKTIQTSSSAVVKKVKGVPVLNYHFFYDPTIGESCNEGICLTVQKFEEELKYISDNGYKALTMDEFINWIYGKSDVPEKSVLITIDDGAMGTGKHNGNKLIPLLEKYKLHATLFLITGWWKLENYLGSDYLEVESHTYDMHKYGNCHKGQLVCASYDEAKADLQLSIDILGSNKAFCYPFYSYDDEAINAVRDLGFKVAFAGGNRDATRGDNKYLIPRYPIHSNITMDRFKSILN